MFGYSGYLLEVDLTSRSTKRVPLSAELTKKYLGGSGLGAALYCEYVKGKDLSHIEPLSPDNPLIFVTGPLTGSTLPSASRFAACSRSPLTGGWGEANAGGFFGPELKKAGYDAIIVKGASSQPVMLCIENEKAEIVDAGELWGSDTYTVADKLKDRGRVLCIGEAGEKLTPLACIAVGKHNFFGRTGLGAVMGSKKLKAITVKGDGKYTPANETKMDETRKVMLEKQKSHPFIGALSQLGSISGVEAGKDAGDLPTKNWQLGKFDGADKIGGVVMAEKYVVGSNTCFACPIACKRVVEVNADGYIVPRGAGPEYETAAAFGSMVLNDNLAAIIKANELCNRYGLDTITTGAMIALAIECYEKGYITKEDTGGMELAWGNDKVIIELVNQIGKVRDFGARLAKGMEQFVADLPPAVRDAISSVKGLPAAYHDPRLLWGLGLDYATGVVGASHVTSAVMFAELGMVTMPDVFGADKFVPSSKEKKAEFVKRAQDYGAACYGCCSFCQFGAIPFDYRDVISAVNAATGYEYDLNAFMGVGERSWVLKRTLNNIWGIRKKDDVLPKRLRQGVIGGPNDGVVPAIDEMLSEYYDVRGLDDDGFLTQDVLDRVGLPKNVLDNLKLIR